MPLSFPSPFSRPVTRTSGASAPPPAAGVGAGAPSPLLQPDAPASTERPRPSWLPAGWSVPGPLMGLFRGLQPSAGAPTSGAAGAGAGAAADPAQLAAALALASNPEAVKAIALAFGPALPANTTFTPVAVSNPALAGLVRDANYDEAKDGTFSVPGAAGTVTMKDVLAQPNPAAFIDQHLSFGSKTIPGVLSVFVPGLNTPEAESERRLENQYSPVMGGRRMAHLHLGSDTDQGDVDFIVAPELVGILKSPALASAGIAPALREEGGVHLARLNAGQRDRAEAVLVGAGLIETQIMKSVKGLLEARLEGPGGPGKLDLMLYSRGSIDGAAAISGWISDYVQRRGPAVGEAAARAEAQKLLRDNVLVETFGNASQQFPSGPQYIHWSATNDPLTKDVGSTAARPQGGGKDALYLHYDGIFQGFDAHNLGAVGAAAAQLSLELNGVSSSRELYAAHRAGKAIATPSTEQLKARIVETKGTDWLWNPQVAMAGVSL